MSQALSSMYTVTFSSYMPVAALTRPSWSRSDNLQDGQEHVVGFDFLRTLIDKKKTIVIDEILKVYKIKV